MKGKEIRSMFLKYFRENGHTVVPSSSLVPLDDPSLLFTNAGMVQFKGTFLGNERRAYSRASSSQKCVRAGGKHNDLENVGRTARHHTFFEMLGNFSFGDYFKIGAIEYAWELLVKRLGLDPDRLYISVHEGDDEAYGLWKDTIGIAPGRILRLGDKDNFWAMGDTGPCGPCSEILYDQGPSVGCGRPECAPGTCDCDRYLEIWNLVFMQFNRAANGDLSPLPRPNIDTGMGLERITAVLQGVPSNYETDLFMPLIEHISRIAGVPYGRREDQDVSLRVVADHARAGAFLVCDGVLPSNEGRGYVLRRIIRRAARHGKLLGVNDTFLHHAALKVVEEMGEVYPELRARRDFIDKVIANEEERFLKTLDKGLALLDEIVAELKIKGQGTIPGDVVFKLYDTFGFPVDLTGDIALGNGLALDLEGFEGQMASQREKARASSAFGDAVGEREEIGASLANEAVTFVGYEALEASAEVLAIEDPSAGGTTRALDELGAGQEAYVVTKRTPFYGESGGQIGDTGEMKAEGLKAAVLDTAKTAAGVMVHRVRVSEGSLRKGQEIRLVVDRERRRAIMRHHSATHLLQRALRDVLGEHVHQAGSLVTDKRLRFDFTHFAPLSPSEIQRVEDEVNRYVLDDLPVTTETMDRDTAMHRGAMALFDEKYGEEVRVITMGDGISVELCGGTHCRATGEIGTVKILSEGSVSAGLRRIEAVAGLETLAYLRSQVALVDEAADRLHCAALEITERIGALKIRLKEQEQIVRDLNVRLATGAGAGTDEEIFTAGDIRVVVKHMGEAQVPQVREVGDRIKERLGSGVVFLLSSSGDKATFMIMVTKDLEAKVHAGEIMQGIAAVVGGRGGGKALFAQGGAAGEGCVEKALAAFRDAIQEVA